MPRASLLSSNFTGGELSPAIALGRMDIAKYNNGARRIENCLLTVQGGAKRRPGTRFIAETKTSAKRSRLVDFVTNRQVSYVLELGDGYMRFFVARVQVLDSGSPFEVVSPYTEAQVPSVNYVQKADTAFFVHEAVTPYRLQRYGGNTNWGFAAVPFITPAIEEQGQFPAPVVTLSNVGPGVANANAAAGTFLKSDVGRTISRNGGSAIITSWSSSSAVLLDIKTPFKSVTLPTLGWNLEGTPQDAIAPSSEGIVGKTVSLNANFNVIGTQVTIAAWVTGVGSAAVQTSAAHPFNTGDTVVLVGTGIDGTYVVNKLDATHFNFPSAFPPGLLGASGFCHKLQTSTDSEVWRSTDVGAYVSINGGMAQITAFIDNTTVNAKVLRAFASKEPAGAGEWQLMTPAWNSVKGYPRAVTINKQRLLYAGSPGYPQNFWASEIQGYLNFQFGTADDEAFRFELDGPRNSPILHLAPAKQLLVLTEADEMSLKGGQEKPITPTNIQKTDESTAGANGVRPVKVGNEILFVQAAGKKIMGAAYRFDIDGFSSPDRTVFASHITGSGVSQLAHQKEPDSLVYAVRTDGQMAVCAYDIEQEVVGWSRWITQGLFESICTVPTATAEDAYTIVNRTIGGATKRYVEVFDPDMLVDCGITGTAGGAGQATWTGLGHLEGKLVQCWADGVNMGEFTVSGGAITLPHNVNSVQIGLGFTCLIEMLQPELGGNGVTAQGSQIHVNEVILRVLDTTAVQINGRNVPFRRFGADLLDVPPTPFTGDVRATTLSDQIFTTSQIITQPYPLPFHLLDVIRRVSIAGGD